MDGNPKSLRESLTLRASTILANYRKHCATASSTGQLILPECMKLMPLYVCCMMVRAPCPDLCNVCEIAKLISLMLKEIIIRILLSFFLKIVEIRCFGWRAGVDC